MSVTCSVSLVCWSRFRRAVAEQDQWTEDALYALALRFPPEPLLDDIKPRQAEFLERLDSLKGKVPSTAPFSQVFNSLFWTERSAEYRIADLDFGNGAHVPESVWSPATVSHFAELWSSVRLEEFHDVFKPAEGAHVAFTSFKEFREYAADWGGIICRGAERGLGIVTFTWG